MRLGVATHGPRREVDDLAVAVVDADAVVAGAGAVDGDGGHRSTVQLIPRAVIPAAEPRHGSAPHPRINPVHAVLAQDVQVWAGVAGLGDGPRSR